MTQFVAGYADALLVEFEQYRNTDSDRARQVADEYKAVTGQVLPGSEPEEKPKPRTQRR